MSTVGDMWYSTAYDTRTSLRYLKNWSQCVLDGGAGGRKDLCDK
jgi:hypothetical protein